MCECSTPPLNTACTNTGSHTRTHTYTHRHSVVKFSRSLHASRLLVRVTEPVTTIKQQKCCVKNPNFVSSQVAPCSQTVHCGEETSVVANGSYSQRCFIKSSKPNAAAIKHTRSKEPEPISSTKNFLQADPKSLGARNTKDLSDLTESTQRL